MYIYRDIYDLYIPPSHASIYLSIYLCVCVCVCVCVLYLYTSKKACCKENLNIYDQQSFCFKRDPIHHLDQLFFFLYTYSENIPISFIVCASLFVWWAAVCGFWEGQSIILYIFAILLYCIRKLSTLTQLTVYSIAPILPTNSQSCCSNIDIMNTGSPIKSKTCLEALFT